MPISVEWGDDTHRYILVTYRGEWTWADYQASYTTRYAMIRTVEHVVDVIVDIRLYPDPPGPEAARYLKWIWETRPPNLGRTIMIGEDRSGFMKKLIQIFAIRVKANRQSPIFVKTMDEALALIDESSPSPI